MGAHIFLVGEDNFTICTRRGVYGCVLPSTEWNKAEVVASISSIQPQDLVFFYVKNQGVYGLWKVINEPFFDDAQVWSDTQQRFPYRFCFEPAVGQFSTPVSLHDVLDLRDKGRIWTFDLNPVQQKNQYKITLDEARELIRLLLRNNPIRQVALAIPEPYKPPSPGKIEIDLASGQSKRIRYEGWLNAWFMRSFSSGRFKELFGDYREFLNLVPTTFNKVMDLFLTHVTTVDSVEVVHKYTCIELKADRATEQDLTQILRYEDWLARRLAAGDHEMIQSILIAHRFSDEIITYIKNRKRIEEKTVRLVAYSLNARRDDIFLEEIPLNE